MKIARKLYVFLVLMLVLVLSLFGVFSYRREVSQFETDMSNDAKLLGSALASAVYGIWRDQGPTSALALIAQANAGESLIHIRWVWLDADAGEMYRPRLAIEKLATLAQTRELSMRGKIQDDSASLYTYIRVETPEGRIGALELAEPLTSLEEYTRASALRLMLVVAALVLVAGLLMGIMGHKMIARPLRSLAEQAHRIGAGDLST